MKNLEKLAKSILSQNPKLDKIFVCGDRNVFASEPQAKKHCEKRGIEYTEFDRESISQIKEVKEAKQEASKPKKSTKSKTTKNK